MTIYNASDLLNKPVPSIAQSEILVGSASPGVNTATGDLLRPLKMPIGFKVAALLVNVKAAFAATAPASIGFSQTDGLPVSDTVTYPSPSTQIAAATDTTHATTGTKLVMPQGGPWVTPRESYLEVLFGTLVTPATGSADYAVLGEFVGSK